MHRKKNETEFDYWEIPELKVDGDIFEFRFSPQADDRLVCWLGTAAVAGVSILFGLVLPIIIVSNEKEFNCSSLFGVFWFVLLSIGYVYFWKFRLLKVKISSERVEFQHPIRLKTVPLYEIEEVLITHQRFWGSFIVKLKRKGGHWEWYGQAQPYPIGPSSARRAIAILTEEFEYRGIPCSSKLT